MTAPGRVLDATAAAELHRLLTRVVAKRVSDPQDREDIVQEALTRTLAARLLLADDAVAPYAVAVARNLVAAHHSRRDLERRHQPRLLDLTEAPRPDDMVVGAENAAALSAAVAGLPAAEREVLLGHVTEGHDTATLAAATGTTPGGVAARLARARARARVDYVVALRRRQLPSPECRPVLLAVSAADRRRQDALDTAGHLLRCNVCPELVGPLAERRSVLAGLVPIPLLVALARIRSSGRPAQATAAAGVAVLLAGAAVAAVLANDSGRPRGSAGTGEAARTAAAARTAGEAGAAGPAAAPLPSPPSAAAPSPAGPSVRAPGPAAGTGTPRTASRDPAGGDAVVGVRTLVGVVTDVAAPYGFWMRAGGREVYVAFTGLPARRVRLGDRASVSGTTRPVTDTLLANPRAVARGERGRVRAAGVVLQADARDIRLTHPAPG